MRGEKEMMELILHTAREDVRIRAAYMGGSRCNPQAPRDIFQDYDIASVVEETESFQRDPHWIDRFGERLYMQYPEDSSYYPSDKENCYGWLIQFQDGNRLDLHVQTLKCSLQDFEEDSLCTVLLDKDGILPKKGRGDDTAFWVSRPSQAQFSDVCNEFWWGLNSLQKALWREEIPYAQWVLNEILRDELLMLLSWKIGIKTDFSCSIGKAGKYMSRWLTKEEYSRFLDTYCAGNGEIMWETVEQMCLFFDETARETAKALGFSYNAQEASASFGLFRRVRKLPKNATEIC